MAPRKLLFPVDRSDEAMRALEWGLANFARVGDTAMLLSVIQPAASFPIAPDVSMSTMYSQINENNEQDGRRLLAECEEIAKKHDVNVEKRLFKGFPTDVIPMVADDEQVDCIVIGSHPYGTVKRFFVGSISDTVVHSCSCPIIVVKPSAVAEAAAGKA